jgi:Phosphotransferase enzyme family
MRDLLVTASAVVRESTRLAVERVAPAWGTQARVPPIPARLGAITPAWMTAVLQPHLPGVRVRDLVQLSGDAGTTTRARFTVSYDDVPAGEEPPASVFVKVAPADFKTRLFVNLLRLGAVEVRFYQVVAPDVTIEVPRVWHAAVDGRAQRFVLVLEDLAARGARFTTAADPMTLDDAQLVIRALARLHARFWDSPRLRGDLAWLRSRASNPTYPIERCLCALAMEPGMRRFPDRIPPALRAAAPRVAAARDRLEDAWARGPLTLIHGDAHAGNLYFPPGGVGFLDWQVVQEGQGMRDVSYFLVNSLPTEVRRRHERDLIALYLATLAVEGVAAPDPAAAWEQHRLHALYAWIGAVVTAAAATLQTEAIVRTALGRSSTAVMDLDAIAALDDLETRP